MIYSAADPRHPSRSSPAPPTATPAALLAPMSERLGGISPHPGGSKGVRRSGITAAVRTGVQHPPSDTLPVNLAQNDWENDWNRADGSLGAGARAAGRARARTQSTPSLYVK